MKPVFVDRSGRRRRVAAWAGAVATVTVLLAAALLVAGFTGAGPAQLPPLPGQVDGRMGGAPKSPRQPSAPAPTPTARTTAPVTRPAAPTSTPDAVSTTTAPAPTRSNHRRVPTHTPGNKPSKPS